MAKTKGSKTLGPGKFWAVRASGFSSTVQLFRTKPTLKPVVYHDHWTSVTTTRKETQGRWVIDLCYYTWKKDTGLKIPLDTPIRVNVSVRQVKR